MRPHQMSHARSRILLNSFSLRAEISILLLPLDNYHRPKRGTIFEAWIPLPSPFLGPNLSTLARAEEEGRLRLARLSEE